MRNELNTCNVDGEKQEISSGFHIIPGGDRVLSCPICCACKHHIFDEKHICWTCDAFNPQPEDVSCGRSYQCETFEIDESSYDYEMVKRQLSKN